MKTLEMEKFMDIGCVGGYLGVGDWQILLGLTMYEYSRLWINMMTDNWTVNFFQMICARYFPLNIIVILPDCKYIKIAIMLDY